MQTSAVPVQGMRMIQGLHDRETTMRKRCGKDVEMCRPLGFEFIGKCSGD